MKKVFLSGATCLLLLAFASHAQAQISPVRLSVSKNQKIDQKPKYRDNISTGPRELEVNDEVHYTIVVANSSAAPVPKVQIKWAILVKPARGTSLKLVEGEHTCSLDLGERCTFDTDLVELTGTKWQSSGGQPRRIVSAQIVGYTVEAYIGDRVVASDIQPSDAKSKIELLKNDKNSGQQRHRF